MKKYLFITIILSLFSAFSVGKEIVNSTTFPRLKPIDSPDGLYYLVALGGAHDTTLLIVADDRYSKIYPCKLKMVNSFLWFPDSKKLAISVSDEGVNSAIFIWQFKNNTYRELISAKKGRMEYFRLSSISDDCKKIYFFYSSDYNKVRLSEFLTKENLYVINVNGKNFHKYDWVQKQ